jgi:F-box-like
MTIDILPEDVLLEIFDFYVDPARKYDGIEVWCTLVHVCRKWRNVVLESPLRLNLRIRCHPTTPVREKADIWPALPIVLEQYDEVWRPEWGVVNVAAALEQLSDRSLWCSNFANGRNYVRNAQAIPGSDRSGSRAG